MKYSILFVSTLAILMIPLSLHAADTSFVPLTQVPAFTDVAGNSNLSGFFNSLYKYCIGIAAILAVLQLIRAGIMYMSPDSIGEKSEAKNLIGLSLFGLLLVLSPVIVFSLIDPRILNLKLDLAPLHSGSSAPTQTNTGPQPPATQGANQSTNQGSNQNTTQTNTGSLGNGAQFADGTQVSCLYPGGGQGNKIATVVAHVYDQQPFLQVRFENETTLRYVAPDDCHAYQANAADITSVAQFHVNDMMYCPLDPPKYTNGQVVSIDATQGLLQILFSSGSSYSFSASSCFKSGSDRERQVCGTPPNCSTNCSVYGSICEPTHS